MSNGIDEGVVAGGALGQKSRKCGGQWLEALEFTKASLESDGSIGSPASNPQSNVEHGSLGNTDLCTLFIGFL